MERFPASRQNHYGEWMKGVILAGGIGSRLTPLTEITNKHLLPVGKEPMIWHAVRQLTGSGIGEILIVTSTHHMGSVVQSLGSGKRFGCEFTYRVQEGAGGLRMHWPWRNPSPMPSGSSCCLAITF